MVMDDGMWPRIEIDVGGDPWVPRLEPGPGWELYITDTTLRDGIQGWRPIRVDEGLRIYEVLAKLSRSGVIESTELFLYTEGQRRLFNLIRDYGARYPRPIGWIRASIADARLVIDNRVEEAVVLTSISDWHVRRKLGLDWVRVREKYLEVIEYLASMGVGIRIALEDITRSDIMGRVIPFIKSVMRVIEAHGVSLRVKLSDTLGLGLPYPGVPPPRGIPAMIGVLRENGLEPGNLEFHGHNDFGLVIANHLAAWLYGASYSNCTLLGIGERAGNCPLEVMLLHYASITGRLKDLGLDIIPEIVELFKSMGYRIPYHQPVVGSNAFNTKAGIHVDGLLKDPEIYLPYHPSIVGRRATIEVNPLGGRSSVMLWLRSLGVGVRGKRDPLVEEVYRLLTSGDADPRHLTYIVRSLASSGRLDSGLVSREANSIRGELI